MWVRYCWILVIDSSFSSISAVFISNMFKQTPYSSTVTSKRRGSACKPKYNYLVTSLLNIAYLSPIYHDVCRGSLVECGRKETEDSASNDVSTPQKLEGGGWVGGNGIRSGSNGPCTELISQFRRYWRWWRGINSFLTLPTHLSDSWTRTFPH